ncbi:MAG: hypothetical protein LBI40_02210 [Treponema sp.]|jgi:hypothetical protein|nr:hypothetical protein [Treponema sp.]
MHIRTSGITAGTAFGLSFLTGLIGGVNIVWLLFRAFFFAMGFFGLTEAIYFISNKFLADKSPEKANDSLQKGIIVDISIDDEMQIPKTDSSEHVAVEDIVEDESVTPEKTPETESTIDTEEWTPIPPVQEVCNTKDNDITSLSDAFMANEQEEVFEAPRAPKQPIDDTAFKKVDPIKLVSAVRTLMGKN